MNVTEEVTIHRPKVSTLLSSAFIKGDLNAATGSPLVYLFKEKVVTTPPRVGRGIHLGMFGRDYPFGRYYPFGRDYLLRKPSILLGLATIMTK